MLGSAQRGKVRSLLVRLNSREIIVMTPTPKRIEWLEALSLLGLRIHVPVHLLTYLLTNLHRITSVFGDVEFKQEAQLLLGDRAPRKQDKDC